MAETTQTAFIQAAVLAQATTRVEIGTNIALAFPRSPTITAMSASDLSELSDGRFVVGLGTQVRRIVEERFASAFDHPANRMAEYVQAMHAVWRMERVGGGPHNAFEGDFYRVTHPGVGGFGEIQRPRPRVFVAAVGPLMTQTAAEHGDGVLGHPFTSAGYIRREVVPAIEKSLEAARRSRASFEISSGLIVSVSDDRDAAIQDAKGQIAFYGTTPNYRRVFDSYGDGELADRLRRVWKSSRQDRDAMIAAVPDEAIPKYAIAGTPAEARAQLATYDGLVDHLVLTGPWWGVPTSRATENFHGILEAFAQA